MVPTGPPESVEPTRDLSQASPRTSIGRYEIRRELGSGAMGKVWHAHDTRLDREVAVKEVHLPQDMAPLERERARARMIREAQAAARVSHPSVVTVHDVLEVDGVPFIVMELLAGESLQDRLRRGGPMTEAEVERIARPLLEALWAAHKAGVVHRDVKPANIMLTAGGHRPVLTDFGIANLPDHGGTTLTGTGAILGTAAYAAPERLEGEDNGAVSDLWSLGATLFAALVGESPFKRDTLTGTLAAVLTQPVPPVPARGRVAAVVAGLLERDPRRRLLPERALALLDAPGAASAHSGPQVPGTGSHPVAAQGMAPSVPVPASASKTSRGPLLIGGAALIALLVAGALTLWFVLPDPDGREEAVGEVSDTEQPSEAPSPEPSEPESPSVSTQEEEAPEGFVWHDDVVRMLVPEDWEMQPNEDDDPQGSVVRLASNVFDTGVETGTAQLLVSQYEELFFDAEGSMIRMDQLLHENEDYSDPEQLMLESHAGASGVMSAVYEARFRDEEREVPERWMFTREITDEDARISYRLSFNFPAQSREEYRDDFEMILDSFEPGRTDDGEGHGGSEVDEDREDDD